MWPFVLASGVNRSATWISRQPDCTLFLFNARTGLEFVGRSYRRNPFHKVLNQVPTCPSVSMGPGS